MLPLIQDSKPFQDEYKKFVSIIERMPAGDLKNKCTDQLKSLVREVKFLDSLHMDLTQRKEIQNSGPEIRDRISNLRKKLDKTLSDWSRSN